MGYWRLQKIILNGKIGNYLTLSNFTTYVFILDFNYPINVSIPDNNIIFGGFKTALTNGIDIALCDSSYYNSYSSGFPTSGIHFNMNHVGTTATNYGGWKGSDFRYDILGATSTKPSQYNTTKSAGNIGYNATNKTITSPVANTLMAALPSDFRSVLKLQTRYVTRGGNYNINDITETTIDAISLMTPYEVRGTLDNYVSKYTKFHSKYYLYYNLGNSAKKYRHNYTSTAVAYWTAETTSYSGNSWSTMIAIYNDGDGSSSYSTLQSLGLAPIFKV